MSITYGASSAFGVAVGSAFLFAGVAGFAFAFALPFASGAAAFAQDLGGREDALKNWYAGCLTSTFGEGRVPEAFAYGASGRAPLFNQGIGGMLSADMRYGMTSMPNYTMNSMSKISCIYRVTSAVIISVWTEITPTLTEIQSSI